MYLPRIRGDIQERVADREDDICICTETSLLNFFTMLANGEDDISSDVRALSKYISLA